MSNVTYIMNIAYLRIFSKDKLSIEVLYSYNESFWHDLLYTIGC